MSARILGTLGWQITSNLVDMVCKTRPTNFEGLLDSVTCLLMFRSRSMRKHTAQCRRMIRKHAAREGVCQEA